MTRIACCIVASIVLAGCNAELKAEKVAWDRYAAQRRLADKKWDECAEKLGLTALVPQLNKAEKECRPLEEAAEAMPTGGGYRSPEAVKWIAAVRAERESEACRDQSRLREAHTKKYEDTMRCASAEQEEARLRDLEFLAACQKCALKERCENNVQLNEKLLGTASWVRDLRISPKTNAPPDARPTAPVFACEK